MFIQYTLIHCVKIQHVQIRQTRGDTTVESEGLLAMVADNAQHSQPRGEFQTGASNNEKGTTTEESVNETNKSIGGTVSEEDCAKNHGWKKGFSLKRQLSKVDLKIKSTFTPTLVTSQNGVLVCFLIYIFYPIYTFRFSLEAVALVS